MIEIIELENPRNVNDENVLSAIRCFTMLLQMD